MRHVLWAAVLTAAAGASISAHHSYSAYHLDRMIEIQGVLDEFEWANPHSLLKVRTEDGRLYTAEWRAASAIERSGVSRDSLRPGDRIIVTGNPRRDLDESGVLNLKSVRRPADGWTWPAL